jgi:hypothetical protein
METLAVSFLLLHTLDRMYTMYTVIVPISEGIRERVDQRHMTSTLFPFELPLAKPAFCFSSVVPYWQHHSCERTDSTGGPISALYTRCWVDSQR